MRTLNAEQTIYGILAEFANAAAAAIDDPESLGSKRSSEMAGFYGFIAGRMPELIREWEETRKADG